MAYPVPIASCDACDQRIVLTAAAFTSLRSHDDEPGIFCAACRELLGETTEEAPEC